MMNRLFQQQIMRHYFFPLFYVTSGKDIPSFTALSSAFSLLFCSFISSHINSTMFSVYIYILMLHISLKVTN